MKKKLIQIKLLDNLIKLDFLLLNRDLFNTHTDISITSRIDFTLKDRKTALLIFDIFHVLRDLKQIIRLLQLSKKQEEKSKLYLLTDNQQYSSLLTFFLTNLTKTQIKIKPLLFKEDFETNLLQQIVFLDNNFVFNNSLFQFLMSNKVFLMSKINTRLLPNSSGIYSLCTNLKDFNKFIFILCLLRQILAFNRT